MKVLSMFVSVSALFCANSAFAGSYNGQITQVMAQSGGGTSSNGVWFVYVSTPISSPAGCTAIDGTNNKRFVVQAGTPAGEAIAKIALSSALAAQYVSIQGSSECGLYGGTEDIWYIVQCAPGKTSCSWVAP